MKRVISIFFIGLFSTAAFAGSNSNGGEGVNCNGNGSCATTSNTTNNITNAPVANGGTGGNASATLGSLNRFGGDGGNASVIGSGNSSNVNTNANTSVNTLGQQQGQKQGQAQGQLQGQGQNQTATGGNASQSQSASNSGVKQNVTVNGDTYEEKTQAPGIGVGYAPASAPCRIAGGGGLSIPGGALTFGGSIEDEECQWRENARSFASVGDRATAVEALCQITRNHVLKVCKPYVPAKAAAATDRDVVFSSYNP